MTYTDSELFVKIAHRGASAYEPENTIASFERAIHMKADLIEFDVRPSEDSHLVVMHDKKVDRTTDGKGYVAHKTLSELKELDAGNGEEIPTFEEVLQRFSGRTKFAIELKENGIENKIVNTIKRYGLEEDCFVISFKPNRLKVIKHLEPSIRTGLISFSHINYLKNAEYCGADAVAPYHWFITDKIIKQARERGLYIFTYVVDESLKARELKERGIHGLVTNKPDVI